MYRQIKQYMLILLAFLFSSLSAIFSIGYIRYHLLIQANPLPDLIAQIQASPDYTPLHEVNQDFIDALLAIEDPTFYTHHGIVFANLLEAAITDFKEHSLLMGGSTITQQLSKNLFLDQRKTFQRKIAELFFVRDLERQYTKDEILELYINIIYFGDGYYGIQAACQGYFQTDPKHISQAQATLLAGIPQAPAIYQLSDGMKYAKARQRQVLEAMYRQALISNEERDAIYHTPILNHPYP